jgi:Ca-activated chloride channel family protein
VKMDLAKEAIRDFVSKLPEGTQVALRVYGHKGSNQQKDKELSCNSTEVVYPLGAYDKTSFQKSLDKFRPTGWTPLAAAIEQAKNDLSGKTGENVENIIYVVSDGIETCGGDPVKAAKELHESEIQAIVNIIGFDVDNAGQRALKKVAEAGGGKYTTVSTGEDLRKHLEEEYERLAEQWELWGIKSWLDAEYQWGDKWEELFDANQAIQHKFIRERERMLAAKDYLASSGKLQDEDVESELDDKIWNRSKLIENYSEERYFKLDDLLEQETTKEQERVEEKAEEMQKKYKKE